jgi:hypothetical protein
LTPIVECQGKRNTEENEDYFTDGVPEILPDTPHNHGVTPYTAKKKWHELLQR